MSLHLLDAPKPKRACTAPGCTRPFRQNGYCATHYQRLARGTSMDPPIRPRYPRDPTKRPPCGVSGCYRPLKHSGYCGGHLRRKMLGLKDWDGPLKLYRRTGTTKDVAARISLEAAESLERQAKARGYDRGEWIRIILEAQAKPSAAEHSRSWRAS